MFLFRSFDMYMVKVLGGHPKDKRGQLKHHTTFCVQQHALGNTCDFHVSLNMVAFRAQPNFFILLSMFMIKYVYSSFANTYFSFYRSRTTKMLSLMQQVLALSTIERG
jgi:hypothetical protein